MRREQAWPGKRPHPFPAALSPIGAQFLTGAMPGAARAKTQ
jgi:hypothetical protein